MRWSERLRADLSRRAAVINTKRGHVEVAREGDGTPVLVIHGGPGGFDQGLMYGRHLRDNGCELIALSRPGYLRTPLSSGQTPTEQANLYATVLDALEIDRITVLGYSSGGPSAVLFAAHHPGRVRSLLLDSAVLDHYSFSPGLVERLLLFSSLGTWFWHTMGQSWPKVAASVLVDGSSTGLDKAQRRAAVEWIMADQARVQSVREMLTSFAPWKLRQAGFDNDGENEDDLEPLPVGEIMCPTMITHGVNDGAVPVELALRASESLKSAELVLIDEGHHLLPIARHFEAAMERRLEFVHSDN
jgi:pimeloyl-ACP methyl ester carboxylesterase